MVYVNQIDTKKYGIEKNKRFLRELYLNQEITNKFGYFDILNCSISLGREHDQDMNLEKFILLMKDNSLINFQLNSPDPFKVVYSVRFIHKRIGHYIFMEYPYNESNFDITSRLYKDSFGVMIRDEPVPKNALEHYKIRTRGN